MSDNETALESSLFEVLPGLPGVGPRPEQFTATGDGTHSEGLVVRFHPRASSSWIGNFVRGSFGWTGALLHPDGRTVLVVNQGQAYQVDPETRALVSEFGDNIADVICDPGRNLLIFSDGIRLWALDPSGTRWLTERLSWDGTRELRIEGEFVVGQAFTPLGDEWLPFSVCLRSGKVEGGSYRVAFK
ncbi:MAG: hypothetical protein HY300_18140 [Verrucomicrobia bacterium]|nr:hypothetical protein [Verrucomicrobiota bacterium]